MQEFLDFGGEPTDEEQIPSMQDYDGAPVAVRWDDSQTPAMFLNRIFVDDVSPLPAT